MEQPSGEMATGEERSGAPLPTPPPSAPHFLKVMAPYLGWVIGLIGILLAVGILGWTQQRLRSQREEIATLRRAVMTARHVFLKRASDELGYASVDLEGNLPNRYQASFRIGEALRWLQDAEPLLSLEGQRQATDLRQTLSQLTVTAEQDPAKAREELAKVRDALERLIRMETQLQ